MYKKGIIAIRSDRHTKLMWNQVDFLSRLSKNIGNKYNTDVIFRLTAKPKLIDKRNSAK
ncbi:MAG: hypothetical protein QGI94_00255 [Candidatus Scalindua sp.]|nr:hypothetical protein [Candidatus Scalindua sp.]